MWSMTYGGTQSDIGTGDTFQISDGGYIILGDTRSFGAGGSDFWLIKTDADGNMQWNKTYGGTLDEVSGGMCLANDGGYAMSGYTRSFGAGGQDAWLVKTDAAGNLLWNMTYGGTGNEYAYAVVQTLEGGYVLSGQTNSFGAGNNDIWLIKTDANGNMLWNMTYGGTGSDVSTCVLQTADGGYALIAQTNSFGAGSNDAWLIKTDATGNMLWNMTYGGTGNDIPSWLVQSGDGGYAIIGWTNSFGAGSNDAWLVKTDATGNLLWNMTYGGTGNDAGIHMIQSADGGYAFAGWASSANQDGFLVKTDASGNLQWNMTYGGTSTEMFYALLQTSDGGYVLTGQTGSFGAGSSDIWLVKTDELGVVPEGLTLGVTLLLSTIAVIVGTRYFRKQPKIKNHNIAKL